jgi:hypothetical protein
MFNECRKSQTFSLFIRLASPPWVHELPFQADGVLIQISPILGFAILNKFPGHIPGESGGLEKRVRPDPLVYIRQNIWLKATASMFHPLN